MGFGILLFELRKGRIRNPILRNISRTVMQSRSILGWSLPVFCLLFSLLAQSQEAVRRDPGVIVRNSDVKSAPDPSATTVTSLRLGSPVEVQEFRGQWASVLSAGDGFGWVPASNVRLKIASAQSGGGSPLAGMLRGVTGGVSGFGADQSRESIAVGVRGVQPSDIESAEPDPVERKKLDDYRVAPSDAERHAVAVPLERRSIAYADEPGSN